MKSHDTRARNQHHNLAPVWFLAPVFRAVISLEENNWRRKNMAESDVDNEFAEAAAIIKMDIAVDKDPVDPTLAWNSLEQCSNLVQGKAGARFALETNKKSEPDFWSGFKTPVSCTCVMGLSVILLSTQVKLLKLSIIYFCFYPVLLLTQHDRLLS